MDIGLEYIELTWNVPYLIHKISIIFSWSYMYVKSMTNGWIIFFSAAIMKNTGMIVSNDIHIARVKALVGNFHRMGITNSLITSMDGRVFAKVSYDVLDHICTKQL